MKIINMQNKIIQADEKYISALGCVPCGIAIAVKNPPEIVYANKETAGMLTLIPDELMSLSSGEIQSIVYPEDLPEFSRFYSDLYSGKSDGCVKYELRIINNNMGIRWLEISANRIVYNNDIGVCAVLRDVTDIKIKYSTQKEWERIFLSYFVNSPLGMAVVSADGKSIVRFNDRLSDILGYSKKEFSGMSLDDIIYPDDLHADDKLRNLLISGRIPGYQIEKRFLCCGREIINLNIQTRCIRDDSKNPRYFLLIFKEDPGTQVTEKRLIEAKLETESILSSLVTILIGVSARDRITHWNRAAEKLFGMPADEIIGRPIMMCKISWDWERIYEGISETITEGIPVRLTDVLFKDLEKKDAFLEITINAIKESDGKLKGFLLTGEEITKRKQLEMQLARAQKLESVGQLASGIAHEINTPTQYIMDNAHFIRDAIASYNRLTDKNMEFIEKAKSGYDAGSFINEIKNIIDRDDLGYISREAPKAISQSIEGLERVSKIVQSMKRFAHPNVQNMVQVDINRAIEDTITISRNEWKYVADLVYNLNEQIPPVKCYPGEINQVLLNIIINSAHAIEDRIKKIPGSRGTITINTDLEKDWILIQISDTGAGIPDEMRDKIYDPFFTTKDVGRGTGQGLAITYDIIVNRHKGMIDFVSEIDKGTTFIIKLPL